jgi:hypothetical protein
MHSRTGRLGRHENVFLAACSSMQAPWHTWGRATRSVSHKSAYGCTRLAHYGVPHPDWYAVSNKSVYGRTRIALYGVPGSNKSAYGCTRLALYGVPHPDWDAGPRSGFVLAIPGGRDWGPAGYRSTRRSLRVTQGSIRWHKISSVRSTGFKQGSIRWHKISSVWRTAS